MSDNKRIERGVLIARLMQGVVYKEDCDPNFFYHLEKDEYHINSYLEEIGLHMLLNRTDNYAFIVPFNYDEEESEHEAFALEDNTSNNKQSKRPVSLLHKQAYGLLATFFLVRLREFLIDHDNTKLGQRAMIDRDTLLADAELVLGRDREDKKLQKEVDNVIILFCEQKILVRHEGADGRLRFEVKRIINSLVKYDDIENIKAKITTYVENKKQRQKK